jgi:DNA-binding GntR family transcriptional regulator
MHNWKFHFAIYQAASMPQLTRMIESCWLMIGSYLNVIYPKYGEIDIGIQNHREIIKAMKAKDADRLCAAVRRDIEVASQCLIEMVRERSVS